MSGLHLLTAPFLIISWNPDPVIFELGFFWPRWYSILFALGFVACYQILAWYFKQEDIQRAVLDKLTLYVVLATVVGARLGHCLFYDFEYYSAHPLEIFIPFQFEPHFEFTGFQGLASHGGAIGILAAMIFFSRQYKISLLWLFDKLSLVIPIAGCFIRIGNLMNSEIIGKPTRVPWAFIFERIDMLPRHPAQLYEAMLYFVIFVALNAIYIVKNKPPGFIFGLFLVLLFSARFVVEFWKEDQSEFEKNLILNMGQLLSIPFIIAGLALVMAKSKTLNHETH